MTDFGNKLQTYAEGKEKSCEHPIKWVDDNRLCHQCNQYVPIREPKISETDQLRARIDEQAATIARLTAAHALQDESLVVLPRHMMNSIEEKMKAQAAEIAQLTEKVRYAYVQIATLEAK